MVLALPLSLGLACGKSGLGNGPLVPTCDNCPAPPEFLYATSPGAIVGFKIDQSTGALGSPLNYGGTESKLGNGGRDNLWPFVRF
jgi:hypothetical protein